MLEQVAELVGRDDPQVDPDPGVRAQTDAGFGRGCRLIRPGRAGSRRCASASGSVAVAITSRSLTVSVIRRAEPASSTRSQDGCAPSAATSGSAIASARSSTTRAGRSPAPANREAGEDRLLGLGAEALQRADAVLLGGAAQGVERVDPELFVEPADPLGPETGQVGHLDHAGRELGAQLDRGRDRALVGQGEDLLLDDRPDAGKLGGAALAGEPQHRHRRLTHRLGGVPVGHDAVDGGAVELGQVAQLVERGGDLGVGRIRHLRYVT